MILIESLYYTLHGVSVAVHCRYFSFHAHHLTICTCPSYL